MIARQPSGDLATRGAFHGLRRVLADESGQAMTEYALTTVLLLGGSVAVVSAWPFTRALFEALQGYLDFIYFWLNVAVG